MKEKDDVKTPEPEKKSEADEKSQGAEIESDFSELEELESEVAAEDAKPEEAQKSADGEEVADEEKKGEDKEKESEGEGEIDDGLSKEINDILDTGERPPENIEGEAKRKVEQAVEHADKPLPPMSEEELEAKVAKDYPGMSMEEFKRNFKFQQDYYRDIVLPDLKVAQEKEKADDKHYETIKGFKHYKSLKPAIDNLLKNDPAIKLLPAEHKFTHAYKLAATQELPKIISRRIKKTQMQGADKRATIPSNKVSGTPKSGSQHGVKYSAEEKAYIDKRGLTEDDLNDPNLSGTTIIED